MMESAHRRVATLDSWTLDNIVDTSDNIVDMDQWCSCSKKNSAESLPKMQ